jgi:predicted TIM-barrel fold metal-dependent hydrolase
MGLDRLFGASYVAWMGFVPGDRQARSRALDALRFNSYFTWMERGIQQVHGVGEEITDESWERVDALVASHYAADQDLHWKALVENGFERLILDTYWNPGDDNGHPEVFAPTFRIDKFMYGVHAEAVAPDDFVPWERYGFSGGTLDDFVELMRQTVRERHAQGRTVALKCAEAYNRDLDFVPDDAEAARRAFGAHPDSLGPEQWRAFSNFMFNRACELAAELGIPFQVHTGLAQLRGSNPMLLIPVLERHPRTRFVLFHSGYPWTQEVGALAHNYANVCPSLTWTATICTAAAVRTLHDYIDVARSANTITWGSDCWVPEESVGALLAWRYIVARVLSERLGDGRLTAAGADVLARKLLFGNGRSLYGLPETG